MKQIRNGIFETNSSATHAFSVIFGDYGSIPCYSESEDVDDVYLSNSEVEDFLDDIPTQLLETILQKRKEKENEN